MTLSVDRYRGALVGLAAGDALGTTIEFSARDSRPLVTDIVGGGPFGLKPGEWTDDTSMAMCLASSLVEQGRFDPVDQMQRYLRWWREAYWSSNGRCFDIGGTVAEALWKFEGTFEPFAGSADPNKAGNGSLMRLAPVPLRYAMDAKEAVYLAAESSRTTHAAPEAVDACRYFSALIVGAIRGATKQELLGGADGSAEGRHTPYAPEGWDWRDHPLEPGVQAIANGSFKRKTRAQIQSTGYVVHTLEAALWAFHQTDNFEDGAILTVNLGVDADTTGAVYGQLAGAFYGYEGIPAEWREKIARKDEILALADALHHDATQKS
jgi:ADP-ribosyl-[dinitrogen reductase] hydrolase